MAHILSVKYVGTQLLSRVFAALWTEPTGFFCPWGFPGKNTGEGRYVRGSFWPRDQHLLIASPALQADSSATELPGKPSLCSYIHANPVSNRERKGGVGGMLTNGRTKKTKQHPSRDYLDHCLSKNRKGRNSQSPWVPISLWMKETSM